jgi:hypothetical protein
MQHTPAPALPVRPADFLHTLPPLDPRHAAQLQLCRTPARFRRPQDNSTRLASASGVCPSLSPPTAHFYSLPHSVLPFLLHHFPRSLPFPISCRTRPHLPPLPPSRRPLSPRASRHRSTNAGARPVCLPGRCFKVPVPYRLARGLVLRARSEERMSGAPHDERMDSHRARDLLSLEASLLTYSPLTSSLPLLHSTLVRSCPFRPPPFQLPARSVPFYMIHPVPRYLLSYLSNITPP